MCGCLLFEVLQRLGTKGVAWEFVYVIISPDTRQPTPPPRSATTATYTVPTVLHWHCSCYQGMLVS